MKAKAAAGSIGETRTQALTEPGVVMRTPLYMNPEQALGQTTDARSDLFSLGVVMYQMATGVLPFHGKTAPEITDAILRQPVTAPVRLNPRIPAELERIILRLLERDPTLRHQTASDLVADLKRLTRDLERAMVWNKTHKHYRNRFLFVSFGFWSDHLVDFASGTRSCNARAGPTPRPRTTRPTG
jgi:serine/threonine protein kinase